MQPITNPSPVKEISTYNHVPTKIVQKQASKKSVKKVDTETKVKEVDPLATSTVKPATTVKPVRNVRTTRKEFLNFEIIVVIMFTSGFATTKSQCLYVGIPNGAGVRTTFPSIHVMRS